MIATSRPPTGPDQGFPGQRGSHVQGGGVVGWPIEVRRGEDRRPGPDLRGDRGLTLVEILVVIAILGLAMLVGTTNWQQWRQARRLEDEAGRIAALIHQARTEARRASMPIDVFIDAPARRLQADRLGRSLALGEGVTLQATVAALGDRPRIVLLPDGSSSGGDLVLSGEGLPQVRLTVSWIDGEVRRAQ